MQNLSAPTALDPAVFDADPGLVNALQADVACDVKHWTLRQLNAVLLAINAGIFVLLLTLVLVVQPAPSTCGSHGDNVQQQQQTNPPPPAPKEKRTKVGRLPITFDI